MVVAETPPVVQDDGGWVRLRVPTQEPPKSATVTAARCVASARVDVPNLRVESLDPLEIVLALVA